MSGTSPDGADAVLMEVSEEGDPHPSWRVVSFRCTPYRDYRQDAIARVAETGTARDLCRPHTDLGEWLGEQARDPCDAAGVDTRDVAAVGSHGQTCGTSPRRRDGKTAPSSSGTRPRSPSAAAFLW